MARLSKDQWMDARQRWEADPTLSMAALAASIGVSKEAVSQTARREGWVRTNSLPSINRAAQIKADAGAIDRQLDTSTAKSPLQASIEASTELRSKLIQSHRAEWRRHAAMFPLEAIKENYKVHGTAAKISAEMIAIRQKGERIAWGMDAEAGDATITIANPRGFD